MIWAYSVAATCACWRAASKGVRLASKSATNCWWGTAAPFLKHPAEGQKSLAHGNLSAHRVAVGFRPRDQVGQLVFPLRSELGLGRM